MAATFVPLDFADFSLDDKYTREEGRIYLTGVQALVRLPLDQHRADRRAGLRTATFISGYRGSPLGGYDMEMDRAAKLLRQHHVVHQPGLNEELAATAVFGSQTAAMFPGAKYDGTLGIWYGKGPGVDRTGDAFKHANYAGVGRNGGVLALGGDDPSSKSSTLPSASEVAFYDALMPVLFPGTPQEVLDLGLHGFALSRASGLWVGMKIVTNVADAAGTALVSPERIAPVLPEVEFDGRPFRHNPDWRLFAPHNLEMERAVHGARLELARRYVRENRLNEIVNPSPGAWLGIITAGKTHYDARQALDELGLDDEALRRHGIRVLRLGMLFPFDKETVREFARGLREILVVEEKRPFLETFTRDALYGTADAPLVVGKSDEDGRPLLPAHSELDPDLIARAVAARVERHGPIASVQARMAVLDAVAKRPLPLTVTTARTAYYCSGCPHNTSNLAPDGHIVGAGIGCHSMAVWMDPGRFGQILGITQMGGEGAQWVGAAPFTETPHMFQNIGDGTLFHSGMLAINFAVASGTNITYKILYNSAVAMTGGQDAVGTLPIPQLLQRLEAEGVRRVIITTDDADKYRGQTLASVAEVWHRDRIIEAQEELAKVKGVTVLIHDQQCAAEKRRLRKRGRLVDPPQRVFINERVCEGCGDCGRASNCLSVQPVDTEFGRKTRIHQSSCNKDYSCLKGDCPSFVTVEPRRGSGRRTAGSAKATTGRWQQDAARLAVLPEPALKFPGEPYSLHMMGIGGTGVVTVNQILGTAAMLEGKHVWGLDQTGLSQKGGPVVSDLKIASRPVETSKVSAGGADLYLGFDLLVAAGAVNLTKASKDRTIAIVSTSQVPTGQMVINPGVRFPELAETTGAIDAVSRAADNVYLDALALSTALFGDHMQANVLLLGAAYQAGALPLRAETIERALRLNGAAVEENIAAFRWGRLAVADPAAVERVAAGSAPASVERRPGRAARRLIASVGADGELKRLLEVRVPDLIAYQNLAYARRYVDGVRRAAQIERQKTPGRTAVAEAVARNLYKLMAYKDEYEVARLHLDAAEGARLSSEFGTDVSVTWNLHPPLLRSLGLKRKLRLGPWFTPAMQGLRAMKRVRGGPLDLFGRAEVRRVERALIPEYLEMVEAALERLTPENHAQAAQLAALPDMVRGYEQIKLDNVRRYRGEARALLTSIVGATR